MIPTFENSTLRQPTISPSPSATATSFDKGDLLGPARQPIPEPQLDGCLYTNMARKSIDFIEAGATFGERINGPCSPESDWPVYCNPNIPGGGLEYPYCVFSTAVIPNPSSSEETEGGIVCARSEERVNVTNPDGSTDECSCLYFNPLLGPVSSCPLIPVDFLSSVPTQAPATMADAPRLPTDNGGNGGNADSSPSPGMSPTIPPTIGGDSKEDGSAAARPAFAFIYLTLVVITTFLASKHAAC